MVVVRAFGGKFLSWINWSYKPGKAGDTPKKLMRQYEYWEYFMHVVFSVCRPVDRDIDIAVVVVVVVVVQARFCRI